MKTESAPPLPRARAGGSPGDAAVAAADEGSPADPQRVDERPPDPRHPAEPWLSESRLARASLELDPPAEQTLTEGMLLSQRYQVLRYLGRGGMGEVYEALDLDLREHVALKLVRPVLSADVSMMERFRREIQLARRVTHPNVCRIFDLGRHRDKRLDVTFLTMELLAGETLEQRIRRDGRLKVEEALPIIEQVAEALDAAHAAGIVHRDFKTSNIILVPAKDGIRAVVTDFGLARRLETDEAMLASSSGVLVGTAAYMAPEQVGGSDASPASDIYSLGVVIYEMVTGAHPHTGASPIELLVNRLSEPPIAPRLRNPDLPARWENVILRCLDREPDQRFSKACDVARALHDAHQEAGRASPDRYITRVLPRPLAGVSRRVWIGIAAVLLLAAAMGFWYSSRPEARARRTVARRSVAVLGFKNLAGRPDTGWLSPALTEMLSSELSAGEVLRAIPSENVHRMKAELGLSEAETYSKETLARIRANLDADVVVLGSYLALDAGNSSPLRVDVRLQDTTSGETLASVSESRTVASIFDIVLSTGTLLRGTLGAGRTSEEENRSVRASLPRDPQAARLYSEGLVSLSRFDLLSARELFKKSLDIDPEHALAHSALAEALQILGEEKAAEAEARKALDTSTQLGREDRLLIEGRFHEIAHDWEKAIKTYRILFEFFPDNIEYGLRLARAQTNAADLASATSTIEGLRRLKGASAADPRIDLVQADIEDRKGNFKSALDVVVAAIRKGEGRGARLLVAAGLLRQSHVLLELGDYERAAGSARSAQAIFQELHHTIGALDATEKLATISFTTGKLEDAARLFKDAMAGSQKLSSRARQLRNLGGLGEVCFQRGELDEARRNYERALALATELADRHMMATHSGNLASLVVEKGELAVGLSAYEKSRALFEEIGDRWRAAAVTVYMGDLARKAGNLKAARTNLESAFGTLKGMGNGYYTSMVLHSLGDLALAEGNLTEARSRLLEAMGIRKRNGEGVNLADSQVLMASIALEEGRYVEAREYAKAARELWRNGGSRDGEAAALEVLARISLAERHVADAASEIGSASLLAAHTERKLVRLAISVTGARVALARKDSRRALDTLLGISKEVSATEFELLRMETGLALAEAERANGNEESARQRLTRIAKESREKGYGLLERKATALLRG